MMISKSVTLTPQQTSDIEIWVYQNGLDDMLHIRLTHKEDTTNTIGIDLEPYEVYTLKMILDDLYYQQEEIREKLLNDI